MTYWEMNKTINFEDSIFYILYFIVYVCKTDWKKIEFDKVIFPIKKY